MRTHSWLSFILLQTMPRSSDYSEIDDSHPSVVYSLHWTIAQDPRALNAAAHRPLAVRETVTYDFVGEFLYS